jgi:hypothetical protein
VSEYPACYIVHTPTGSVYSCERHAQKLGVLFQSLGSRVLSLSYSGDAPCVNCVNENKKAEVKT